MAGLGVRRAWGFATVYKALNSIFNFWKEAVTFQTSASAKLPNARISTEISPEYLGVGYILGPRVGGIMVSGSVLAWLVLIPLLTVIAHSRHGHRCSARVARVHVGQDRRVAPVEATLSATTARTSADRRRRRDDGRHHHADPDAADDLQVAHGLDGLAARRKRRGGDAPHRARRADVGGRARDLSRWSVSWRSCRSCPAPSAASS